jgi:type IV secretory pathway VirB3-like protein
MSREINTEEPAIWEGRPSQWLNFKSYAYCVIMTVFIVIVLFITTKLQWLFVALLLYPVGKALFVWYEIRSISYKITALRILHRSGIFNRVTTETKLSDVREVLLIEPWYERIVKLGEIRLNLKGFAESYVMLSGIRKAGEIKELINKQVCKCAEPATEQM